MTNSQGYLSSLVIRINPGRGPTAKWGLAGNLLRLAISLSLSLSLSRYRTTTFYVSMLCFNDLAAASFQLVSPRSSLEWRSIHHFTHQTEENLLQGKVTREKASLMFTCNGSFGHSDCISYELLRWTIAERERVKHPYFLKALDGTSSEWH